MTKYIDAEKLKAEIKRQIEEEKNNLNEETSLYYGLRQQVRSTILRIIDSLQREPEVDLEKYIENEINHYGLSLYEASYGTFSASQIDRIIRKAFELGLNARKEE